MKPFDPAVGNGDPGTGLRTPPGVTASALTTLLYPVTKRSDASSSVAIPTGMLDPGTANGEPETGASSPVADTSRTLTEKVFCPSIVVVSWLLTKRRSP